jgi:hypothetical protein
VASEMIGIGASLAVKTGYAPALHYEN